LKESKVADTGLATTPDLPTKEKAPIKGGFDTYRYLKNV
jgi:hypothetical protein